MASTLSKLTPSALCGKRPYLALLQVNYPQMPPTFTSLPPAAQCPNCRLLYREFCEHGLLGCEQCYLAFAPAIREAIAVLRKEPGHS